MTQEKEFQYHIPANVMLDEKLSPMSKLVFSIINALAKKEGFCWASSAYIAKLLNRSRVCISRSISELNERGYIEVEIASRTKRKILVSKTIHPCINSDTPLYQKCYETCINSDTEYIKGMIKESKPCFTPEGVMIE